MAIPGDLETGLYAKKSNEKSLKKVMFDTDLNCSITETKILIDPLIDDPPYPLKSKKPDPYVVKPHLAFIGLILLGFCLLGAAYYIFEGTPELFHTKHA
uniref:Deltameth_res domain-containing protein n=1 Tax=Panagrellus redivivus TaxID=6233 RepID=A0A7E4UT86_PANRE